MNFGTLYNTNSAGKTLIWKIWVKSANESESESANNNAVIYTSYGHLNGKIQENRTIIKEGKNIGKKNETTPLRQACIQALAQWEKKRDSGYNCLDELEEKEEVKEVKEVKENVKKKAIDEDVPLPMLAHDLKKQGNKIQTPCFVQPKLDGTRCVGVPGKGLFSRNRKSYPHMAHILKELEGIPFMLDGELYSDKLTFQEIVGLVKKETLTPDDEKKQELIQFHIYDHIGSGTFEERFKNIQSLFKKPFKYLVLVKTEVCSEYDDIFKKHKEYIAEGWEGVMIRNRNGLYKSTRSVDLQKYKDFMDEEFKITGFQEGVGLESGCVVWTCETKEGKSFACRPQGSREDRMKLFLEGDSYIGKFITVKFQEWTDGKLPRFPVGISIRDE